MSKPRKIGRDFGRCLAGDEHGCPRAEQAPDKAAGLCGILECLVDALQKGEFVEVVALG